MAGDLSQKTATALRSSNPRAIYRRKWNQVKESLHACVYGRAPAVAQVQDLLLCPWMAERMGNLSKVQDWRRHLDTRLWLTAMWRQDRAHMEKQNRSRHTEAVQEDGRESARGAATLHYSCVWFRFYETKLALHWWLPFDEAAINKQEQSCVKKMNRL